MDQTVLLLIIIGLAIVQGIFLINRRYLFRGIAMSAVSGTASLAAVALLFPELGLTLATPSLIISGLFGIPGCVFLLLIKLICGV